MPDVTVLGAGSFGTVMAHTIACNGNRVSLWMRDSVQAAAIETTGHNPKYLTHLKLSELVKPTTDLIQSIKESDMIVVALPSQILRTTLIPIAPMLNDKFVLSTTKGIEASSFLRMSQIIAEIAPKAQLSVLSGPNLAFEMAEEALSATVIASESDLTSSHFQQVLHGSRLRVYTSQDMNGVELAGALKNVYAIIAGIADAKGMGENTRSMLITRALAEMTRFAVHLGANPLTFMGLAGVGDLLLTCTSKLSRNYRLGHAMGKGLACDQALKELGGVAEGIHTLPVVYTKSKAINVYMPLVSMLHGIVQGLFTLDDAIIRLMQSEPKNDIDFGFSI